MLPLSFFLISCGAVFIGLFIVLLLFRYVSRFPVEHQKALHIAHAIQLGAMTFLKEEYRVMSYVLFPIALGMTALISGTAAFLFITGALFSMATGFIGMRAATIANVRTTLAAKNHGEQTAFQVAFAGGGIMGFAVGSFGILGLSTIIYLFSTDMKHLEIYITAFAFGASLVAFFARVGGGIYTKSADVGADLVGKLEAGIPEDDPRNPAVIADNVGDCVGDTAGMGADIYESYLSAMIAACILAMSHYQSIEYLILPIMLSVIGLGASAVSFFINLYVTGNPATLLRNSMYYTVALLLAGSYGYLSYFQLDMSLFISIIIGCAAGIVIGIVSEYYTGGKPVRQLADVSRSGAATNVVYGLSIGMESTALPVILLALSVIGAYVYGGGIFGVALTAVAMLALVAITMTIDAYGPIADNAGGIAEMAGFGPKVRTITDRLDALGNTTAAMGKGFAIGSALLAGLALFSAYTKQANMPILNVLDPAILAGMFIGGTMPFIIAAVTMRSVGKAALYMVFEVRRQFKEIAGIMEGTTEPDYKRCIEISTHAALKEMILPGVLTVCIPVVLFFGLGKEVLAGYLVGVTVVGVLLGLMMTNGGGAWDNAKKYIEAGNVGGKGSDAHKAAITGDTVGDPFKDTAGPTLNILIKLTSILSLILIAL